MNPVPHPRQRPGLSRRAFLARAAGVSITAGGLGALVVGYGPSAAEPPGHELIPVPNRPVTWPIAAGNPPLADGRLPGRHPRLKVFSWAGHVNQRCLDDFARKYRCQVELATFTNFGQALAILSGGPDSFDVLLGAPNYLTGVLIGRNLISPLNHSYLPNLSNLWTKLASPYYDVGLRYTVPYTVYTTGIAWRKDLVDTDPYAMANGWQFPWVAGAKGKTAILDDFRAAIGLALLQAGADINTTDPYVLDAARAALRDLGKRVGLRVDNETSAEIASGQTWVHHAWSGQAAAAAHSLPSGVPVEAIGYWFPPSGVGPVGNDTGAVLRGGQSAVLAHLFLNFLLDPHNAMVNISRIGYTQPLTFVTPARLVREGILPPGLTSAAVLSTYTDRGLKEVLLPDAANALWGQVWDSVSSRHRPKSGRSKHA